MTYVAIRRLKAHLSRYIDAVRRGDEVVITKRGRPVARLVGEPAERTGLREELAPLAAEGLISLPERPLQRKRQPLAAVTGKPVSEIVLEDRR
jgi:prevent-host-death family protein